MPDFVRLSISQGLGHTNPAQKHEPSFLHDLGVPVAKSIFEAMQFYRPAWKSVKRGPRSSSNFLYDGSTA